MYAMFDDSYTSPGVEQGAVLTGFDPHSRKSDTDGLYFRQCFLRVMFFERM